MKPSATTNVVDPSAPDYVSRQVESSRLFWLEPEREESEGLMVISAGYEVSRPDFRIDRPGFKWLALEFVLGGKGQVAIGDEVFVLGANVWFLYGPGIEHHIRTDPGDPLKKYNVVFAGREAAGLLERIGLTPGAVSQSANGLAMKRAFDELIERGSRQTGLAGELCSALLRQILLMAKEDAIEAGATDTKAYATYRRVREFIAGHALRITTLDGIAAECGLDAAYLCRLFARFQEESPYQYLTRLRMEHAAGRLLDSELTVKAVSQEMGFSDPFHFSRVFKSVHRVPPSRFRKGNGGGRISA